MSNKPDKVPDTVINAIAEKHVKYVRQGECPSHDNTWKGKWVPRDEREDAPCTCAIKMARFNDILKALEWSYDHYYFNYAGMYVGVELDGYMHT